MQDVTPRLAMTPRLATSSDAKPFAMKIIAGYANIPWAKDIFDYQDTVSGVAYEA